MFCGVCLTRTRRALDAEIALVQAVGRLDNLPQEFVPRQIGRNDWGPGALVEPWFVTAQQVYDCGGSKVRFDDLLDDIEDSIRNGVGSDEFIRHQGNPIVGLVLRLEFDEAGVEVEVACRNFLILSAEDVKLFAWPLNGWSGSKLY